MPLLDESSFRVCRPVDARVRWSALRAICCHACRAACCVVFLFGTAAAAEGSKKLRVLTEEWPPVSYTEGGRPTGLAVDIVTAMLRRAGRDEVIEFVPWARGYKMVSEVPNVILFPMARSPERERLVTMIGPLLEVRTELYQRRGDVWIDRMSEAKQSAVVGAYRASYAEISVRRAGYANLSLATSPDRSARMLLSGRVDLWAEAHVSAPSAIRKAGGDSASLERVAILDVNPLMVAVSPGTPLAVSAALEQALREMKADGEFQRLFYKWYPSDIPPPGVERIGRKAY